VSLLPPDLQAGVLVATHLAPHAPNRLAKYLANAGSLPAVPAADRQRMQAGTLYTAVPDRHLLLSDHDLLRLTRGPRENRVRPAVDALFRSAARWCGPRVIGVVLSGSLDDGAAGLAAIVERGGTVLVQQPDEAKFPGMPRAALRAVPDAAALSATQIARAITQLAGTSVSPLDTEPSEDLIWETDMIENVYSSTGPPGQPMALGCPECSGGMSVMETGKAVHYVCHTGHSYSPETFVAARDDNIETALWTALSSLEEQSVVLEDMAARADQAGDHQGYHRNLSAVQRIREAMTLLGRQPIDEADAPQTS